MSKAVKAQLEVKSKCDQMQQSLKDLYDWEHDVKQKEQLVRQQQQQQQQQQKNEAPNSPPVRSNVDEMNKFSEDQRETEKHQMTALTVSTSMDDLKEAEVYNQKGNDFMRMIKAGSDVHMYSEKLDVNAIDMYTNAIELNGQNPSYFVNRANCYFNMERYEECIADCDAAIALDQAFYNAHYRRMKAYEYMGNGTKAYEQCQKMTKMPQHASEITRLKQDMERIKNRLKEEADKFKAQGNKHLQEKDYQKALECFSKAIATFGYDAIYYHNRSLTYFHLREYDCCLKDCNKAIELDANYFRPYYQRMRVRELHADYHGAINDCKKFLEMVKDEKQRITAQKDLERLQQSLQQSEQPETYNWNELRKNASLVSFVQKAPHLRSKKPLKRIPISDVTSSSDEKMNSSNYVIASDYETIPDSVIDKIFNNNTGERAAAEPKRKETNLENLFPSSSSHKLKQLFSPPTTPSSPPKEPFGKQSPKPALPDGKKAVAVESGPSDKKVQPKSNVAPPAVTKQSAAKIKLEKDKINQENCPSEVAQPSESEPAAIRPATQAENKSANNSQTQTLGTVNPLPPIPTSSIKLYHTWCNMKTQEEKYQYLQAMDNAQLHKLMGSHLDSEMLSDILQTLQRFCPREKKSPMKVLSVVGKHPETGLLTMMLEEKDKQAMIKLLDLMDELEDDKTQLRAIMQSLRGGLDF